MDPREAAEKVGLIPFLWAKAKSVFSFRSFELETNKHQLASDKNDEIEQKQNELSELQSRIDKSEMRLNELKGIFKGLNQLQTPREIHSATSEIATSDQIIGEQVQNQNEQSLGTQEKGDTNQKIVFIAVERLPPEVPEDYEDIGLGVVVLKKVINSLPKFDLNRRSAIRNVIKNLLKAVFTPTEFATLSRTGQNKGRNITKKALDANRLSAITEYVLKTYPDTKINKVEVLLQTCTTNLCSYYHRKESKQRKKYKL